MKLRRRDSVAVQTDPRPVLLRAAASTRAELLAIAPVGRRARPSVAGQRDDVRQTLLQIHAALDRLDQGTYGDCARCRAALPDDRLAREPWSDRCGRCAA